jgi:hypothetical protein
LVFREVEGKGEGNTKRLKKYNSQELHVFRSPIRVPDKVDFFIYLSRTMALGSTQPLTEMSTRSLPEDKKRPARRADNLAAIYEPNI